MKNITLLLLLFITSALMAQKSINNYKYIIVSNHFDFLKKPDQYQTSSLTKFLFNKKGFTTFLSDEKFPNDLASNRCLALVAGVKNSSSMFSTRNVIELKDCNNKVVIISKEGKSKQKVYKKAYHEAIRNAFKSMGTLNYSYVPLEEEIAVSKVIKSNTNIASKEKIEIATSSNKKESMLRASVLYAQAKLNGFQLVNTKPEVVFEILKTNVKEVFILKSKKGIMYKSGQVWIAEYYEKEKLIQEQYQIKF